MSRDPLPLSNLAESLDGTVRTDLEAVNQSSTDFGRVLYGKPQAIVCPASVSDIVAVVRWARQAKCTVAVRGAGHSQGGQSLSNGGLVVDLRSFDEVEEISEDEGWAMAGAGVLWRSLVELTSGHGLAPPVLTDNLAVTIGGTLSVGGLGATSFRHGFQTRHCLGIEVVLGTGEVVWLTPESEPDLFHCALGGLGQFGIITKAKLRLRPFRRCIHSIEVTYPGIQSFLDDASTLMKLGGVHSLQGFARLAPGNRTQANKRWDQYVLELGIEVDEATDADRDHRSLVQALSTDASWTARDWRTQDHFFRFEGAFAGRPFVSDQAHPWVEHFLPRSAVEQYVDEVAASLPGAHFLLWPLNTEPLRLPMTALPETSEVVLVGIITSIPLAELPETLPRLQAASDLGLTLGGKRYLSGWLESDQDRWREHYGPAQWKQIVAVKQRCDPDRVLRSLPFVD
jgi:FAD/FMN-containing dehydrogenase